MKRNVFLLVLVLWMHQLSGQSITKTDVTEVKIRNAGPVINNNRVTGYYSFYNVEKKDRKNNNYLLSITDENLKEINSVDLVRPNTYLLMEACFNGEAFGFLFYERREKKLELVSFDKNLKQTGKVMIELENKYAQAQYEYIAQGHEPTAASMVSVPGKGFLYYGLKQGSKSDYLVAFYDNAMKRKWAAVGPDDKFDFENAGEGFQTADYVGTVIMKRTSALSMDVDMDLMVLDVITGKPIFRVPLETNQYKVSLTEVVHKKENQQFVVYGEYFDKKQNIIKDQSQGFITVVLDSKGKVVSEKVNSWKKDIVKLVAEKDKGTFEDTNILFHEFVSTADGRTFAIGEQYRKGGAPMAAKIVVQNLVIFEFDANFAITKVHVFEKDKNSVALPSGLLIFTSKLMSYIAKSMGGFDYVFTQIAPDNNTFSVHYINYDREKGEKGKNILGSVIYTPEKTFSTDKLPLNRKSSIYFLYKGKDGYVMVSEYFAKEKRLDSRLEKLNY